MRQLAFYLLMLMPGAQYFGSALPDILASSIAIMFLIKSILEKNFSWLRYSWVKASLILWVYLVLRSLFVEDVIYSLKVSVPWVRFIVFSAAVAEWLLNDNLSFKRFLNAISLTLIAISLNSISQFLLGIDIFGNKINYAEYPRLFAPSGKLSVGIMTSFYILPLVSAALLNRKKSMYICASIFGFLTILLSGERTALILTVAGIFLIMIFSKVRFKHVILTCVVIALTGMGIYITKKEVFDRQIVSSYQSISNYVSSSYGIIHTSALTILHNNNQMFGIGPKRYNKECRKFGNSYMTDKQIELYCISTSHPHNIYLEMLLDGGYIGFLLFIIFVYTCVREIFRARNSATKHFFGLGAGVTVILKLFPFAPISSIYFAWSMVPFWLMLGAVSSCIRRTR